MAENNLKRLTLFFVEGVFALEGAISRLSVERLCGQQVLFADSVQKLAGVFGFAEKAVDHFNFIAKEIGCPALDRDEIRMSLQAEIDQQVARTILVARSVMLNLFGEGSDLRANYDQLLALEPRRSGDWRDQPDAALDLCRGVGSRCFASNALQSAEGDGVAKHVSLAPGVTDITDNA